MTIMERPKLFFSVFCFIFGSLKDGLFIQFIILSCWSIVTMATYDPIFNDTPVNLTYYTGETATLKCSVSHLGPSKVIWKREDQPHALTVGKFVFVSDPKYSIKHIPYKNEWNLVIDKIKPRHAGFYECQISTKKDMKRYVQLNIIDEPAYDRRYINITGPQNSVRGQKVRLTCNVSGFRKTPKHIRWYINDTHLVNGQDSNIRIVTYQRSDVFSLFSELDIGKLEHNNVGYYTCKATYGDGLKTAKYYLFIDTLNADGKPSKRGTVADGTDSPSLERDMQISHNSANIQCMSIGVSVWFMMVTLC